MTTLPNTLSEGGEHSKVTGLADNTLIGDAQHGEFDDTVGFRSEGKVIHTQYDEQKEDLSLLPSVRPSLEELHSIRAFLSRPVRIATIKWSADDAIGKTLGEYSIVDTLNSDNMLAIRQKLAGFYGIHATAELKVLVNPQPFQAGMFQIYYIPFSKTFVHFPYQLNDTEFSLPFSTGCPHVLCNLATQSAVSLAVPYTGPSPFVTLPRINSKIETSNRDWGTFFVQNISSIRDSTNAAACEMSIFMRFTDVQLFGAVYNPWTFQADFRSEEEESKVSRVMPGLGGGGLSLGGLARALPEVLDALGLSKPAVNQSPSRLVISPFGNMGLLDSTDPALKVSMTSDQATVVQHIGVDQTDEMDIMHIIQDQNYYFHFSWSVDDPVAKQIFQTPVEPNALLSTKIPGANFNIVCPSKLRYVAEAFYGYNGGIVYHFHILGTKFHSGRLRFVLDLAGMMGAETPGAKYPFVFSQVIDIRDGFSFKVVCPYFASTPWRAVPKVWDDAVGRFLNAEFNGADDPVNWLRVFVENTLRAGGNCSNRIQVVVTVGAAPDFQLNMPTRLTSFPFHFESKTRRNAATVTATAATTTPTPSLATRMSSTTTTTTETPVTDASNVTTTTVKPQCDLEDHIHVLPQGPEDDIPIVNMVTMTGQEQQQTPMPNKVTVGETITNLRALVKRYALLGTESTKRPEAFLVFPFVHIRNEYSQDQWILSNSYMDYFWPMYRFSRGGMRYLFIGPSLWEIKATLKYDPDNRVSGALFPTAPPYFGRAAPIFRLEPKLKTTTSTYFLDWQPTAVTMPYKPFLQGGVHVEVPYYSTRVKQLNRWLPKAYSFIRASQSEGDLPQGMLAVALETPTPFAEDFNLQVYRAPADDFNLGFLLGALPLAVNINYNRLNN